MKIEHHLLWKDRPEQKEISYTAYLVENQQLGARPAVIICGGGGFRRHSPKEQEPVALYFLNKGFQAFVLNYSIGENSGYPKALYDIGKLLLTIREKAAIWHVHPSQIILIGFSAGATHCASLATQWDEPFLQKFFDYPGDGLKANLAILSYPLLDFQKHFDTATCDPNKNKPTSQSTIPKQNSLIETMKAAIGKNLTPENLAAASPINHISKKTIPLFIWGFRNDDVIYTSSLLSFAQKLQENNVFYELHLFAAGKHASSLINQNTQNNWQDDYDLAIWRTLCMHFTNRILANK